MTWLGAAAMSSSSRYRLENAVVPVCCLEGAPPGNVLYDAVAVDIVVDHGQIAAITPVGVERSDLPAFDLDRRQVWPTLIDMHAHIDKGHVLHRLPRTGSLDDAQRTTAADTRRWTEDDLFERMDFALRCAYVHGVSTVRTHLDSIDGLAPRSFAVFDRVRREWAGRVEVQAVAITGLDAFLDDRGVELADICARYGGILGGVTDVLAQAVSGVYGDVDLALDRLFGLAAERGLDVDLHVDQTANPAAFALPLIARSVLRTRFPHRVVCGHCVNLALQSPADEAAAIALVKEAGLAIVTLPTPMMYLMDRQDGRTPRWRGVTLAHELRAAGVPLAIGGDNTRDAWYPYGDHDMVDTLRQATRIFQLDEPDAVAMAGPIPADIVAAKGGGRIAVGRPAKLILFNARSYNSILCRPQSDRIVIDRGAHVTMPLPDHDELIH